MGRQQHDFGYHISSKERKREINSCLTLKDERQSTFLFLVVKLIKKNVDSNNIFTIIIITRTRYIYFVLFLRIIGNSSKVNNTCLSIGELYTLAHYVYSGVKASEKTSTTLITKESFTYNNK